MEDLKKKRTPVRAAFTKLSNDLKDELKKDEINVLLASALLKKIETKGDRLRLLDEKIMDLLVEDGGTQDEVNYEYEHAEAYQDRFHELKTEMEDTVLSSRSEYQSVSDGGSASVTESKRKFKLPKIEWKKFGGDPKDWLGFWGQFQKIDEDKEMDAADKFQYLLQAVEDGSRAAELVKSFPPSAKCYPKAIESLKDRFGNDETLVEVYVRELLKLVLHNAMNPKTKVVLSSLYDRLETQLRALETLGVASDKYASMLYPLVESCLPEDVLRTWERNRNRGTENTTAESESNKNQLTLLMEFLRGEVKSEERISMARKGFSVEKESRGKKENKKSDDNETVPTATALFVGNDRGKKEKLCEFCDKTSHFTHDCNAAKKMPLVDKQNILKKKGACFSCFGTKHTSWQCTNKPQCPICPMKHFSVMCPELPVNKTPKKPEKKIEPKAVEESNLANNTSASEVLLQTLMVLLLNGDKEVKIRAVLDNCSQCSYLSERAAKAVGYTSNGTATIDHNLFGGVKTKGQEHNRYHIRLCKLDKSYYCNFATLGEHQICADIPKMKSGPWLSELKKDRIVLSDTLYNTKEIDLLIGADVGGKLLTGNLKKLDSGPVAVETYLGWTLMGKVPGERRNDSTALVTTLFVSNAEVQNLWKLDSIGINDPAETKTNVELQQAAMEHFNQTVIINDEGRYEVSLPFISDPQLLPTNEMVADRRMKGVTKKLIAEKRLEDYKKVFSVWLDEDVIEEIPPEEYDNYGHYLPHRGVFKEVGTTKIRPVFDASAKQKAKPSLNDLLEKGPNLLELIPTVLTRFRLNKIGVIADIKKAFLQISVKPEDRDYLRFLFWNDSNDPENFKKFRHRRVVFDLSCSPFLLGATLNFHLDRAPNCMEKTARLLKSSIYVDNCVTSLDSEWELEKFMKESVDLLAMGKFDLRGWEWNNSHREDRQIPVLGLSWNLKTDTLSCDLRDFQNEDLPVTMRKILSYAHRIFDHIGFSVPKTLLPKLLLQEAWALNVGWDKELPEKIANQFTNWVRSIKLLKEVKIPRWTCRESTDKKDWTHHVFADASKYAYAACVFLRVERNGIVSTQLLLAKSRVAPVKQITIPRLELMACCIAARLAKSAKDILNYPEITTYYWTDSSNALCWIQRENIWGVFVSNRVKEIGTLSNVHDWRSVPGKLNPADLPSRGCTAKVLLRTSWWEGPDWLKREEAFWPKGRSEPDDEVLRAEERKTVIVRANTIGKRNFSDVLMDTKRRVNFTKVVKIVARMYRFIGNCIAKVKKQPGKAGVISVAEMEKAELIVARVIQIEAAKVNPDYMKGIRVFTDDIGVIRVKTKIVRRDDTPNFKAPVVLSNGHPLVKLLVIEQHLKLGHGGTQTLLCDLREKYWIVRARKIIQAVVRQCIRCQRFNLRPQETEPPPLPMDRVRQAAVFEVTGVDLAGPLILKDGSKSWIVLYTCAVYRAIHLELVTAMSTEAFLQSLRRFISRRGRPKTIYSDNGTNFVGAYNIFEAVNWKKIEEYAINQKINWHFIVPTGPWWGGWWERLVQMTKKILRRVLGRASLNYEELSTVLCDTESIINKRPLTYVSENPDDLTPLTPAMFLQEVEESGVLDMDLADGKALNKRIVYRQRLREDLRKRFRQEYLSMLLQPGKKIKKSKPICQGDIALVGADNVKRIDWILARVLEVFPGKDGVVRVAKLRTATGELTRPIQRIYPLEIPEADREVIIPLKTSNNMEHQKPIVTRSGRTVKAPDRFMA